MRSTNRSEVVLVAVPAHDEVATITDCLHSIDVAAGAWGGRVLVVVGADACTDATAARARAARLDHCESVVVESTWRGASPARRAIVEVGLAHLGVIGDATTTWIANTDADGVVPASWITRQVELAERGADLVLGTVDLAASTRTELTAAFARSYRRSATDPHHVHAANLGIRASVYLAAGGWHPGIAVGEEHDLVERARAVGATPVPCHDLTITTSNRTTGRVEGGFASALAALLAGCPAPPVGILHAAG